MLDSVVLRAMPLAVLVALAAGPAGAADGEKVFHEGGADSAALACVTCHGAQAQGLGAAGFPALAGTPAAYLAKQIADFRSGARMNPVMQPIATALSDAEVSAVAASLAAMPGPTVKEAGRADAAVGAGAKLALRGAWDRNVPECVACHGPGGVGVGASFPPLAGQSSEYLSAQLDAWRQGTRKNDPQALMGHIARALSDDEVRAVSEYFAGLGQWRVPQ